MKFAAFACPPMVGVLMGLLLYFHPQIPPFLNSFSPLILLFILLLGFALILMDKTLKTGKQKFLYCLGYIGFIFVLSATGGFLAGLLMAYKHHIQ